jgi:hypothetical protein
MTSPPLCLLLVAVSVVGLSCADTTTGKKWGYKETTDEELGPADWKLSYSSCGGTHQSPVNFPMYAISDITFWDFDKPPLKFGGECEKFTLKKLEDLYKWEIHENEGASTVFSCKAAETYVFFVLMSQTAQSSR